MADDWQLWVKPGRNAAISIKSATKGEADLIRRKADIAAGASAFWPRAVIVGLWPERPGLTGKRHICEPALAITELDMETPRSTVTDDLWSKALGSDDI